MYGGVSDSDCNIMRRRMVYQWGERILVEPNQITSTATALIKALRDDELVEFAMTENLSKSKQLFSEDVLREKAKKVYSLIIERKN
ncbi:hypothetical protein EMGBS4_15640 [Acidimicrobiaceae bacterium]|nr:hypothetical protein EMGBS4_15640 [Acidimicrobiaceae bacterium]